MGFIVRVDKAVADEKVQSDGTAGGFKVQRQDPLHDFANRDQLETFHFSVSVAGDELRRQFQVEDEFRVGEKAPFTLKVEPKTDHR